MFKKKCISIFISFSLFVLAAVSVSGNNRQILHSNEYYIKENIISNNNDNNNSLKISSKSAVLIENNSGRILYSKSKDKEMIPASITKIMTLNLIFDALESGKIKLDDEVSTSEYAASMGGSQATQAYALPHWGPGQPIWSPVWPTPFWTALRWWPLPDRWEPTGSS